MTKLRHLNVDTAVFTCFEIELAFSFKQTYTLY